MSLLNISMSSLIYWCLFLFRGTLGWIFKAIVFILPKNHFVVGDRYDIQGVQMIVEKKNICSTIFLRYDNLKVSYPNALLAKLPIRNISRISDMGDAINFCIHSTPMEMAEEVTRRIIAFMEEKKDHWHPGAEVVMKNLDSINMLDISITLRHKMNFHDLEMKFTRRELVIQELIKILRELNIEHHILPLDDFIEVFKRDIKRRTSSQ